MQNTIASGEIIEGGIGYNYAIIRVVSKAENISCMFEKFENGTYTTALPTTTQGLTTPKPEEGDVKEWGKIDDETKLSEYV